MNKLIILLLLSGCTISYYYKGKDLVKNQSKIDKEVAKSLKGFNQIKKVDKVAAKIKKSKFKNKKAFIKEMMTSRSVCLNHKARISTYHGQRRSLYAQLRIKKNKKYTSKSKNYKKIKSYIDSHDNYAKNMKKFFKQAQSDCGKIQKIFKKYDVKMMNANKLYSKFGSYKKSLISSKNKVKKKIKTFRRDLNSSKHKNKSKINLELSKLDVVLKDIVTEVKVLEKEITNLKSIYGTKGDIPIILGSEAYIATENLKNKSNKFSSKISNYNKIINNINELVEENK